MNLNPSPGESIGRRLWQVVLTYTQVWTFRLQVPALIIYIIAARWAAPQSSIGREMWGFFAVEQVVLLSLMVADHVKGQMDDWRSALTPGFRLPHMLVAAVILTTPLWCMPLLMKDTLQVSAQGLTALTMLFSALLAWIGFVPLTVFAVACVLIFIKGEDSSSFVADALAGKLGMTSAGIIWASSAALVLLWIWLWKLNGQSATNARLQSGNVRIRARMTMNPRNERTGLLSRRGEWLMEKISRLPSPLTPSLSDRWSRVQQRRLVTGLGLPPSWFMASVLFFFALVLGICCFDPSTRDSMDVRALVVLLTLAVPWLLISLWPMRWQVLAAESLLPASRSEFALETGLALFTDLVSLWISSTVAALALAFLWSPHDFLSQAGEFGSAIALAAAGLIFTFGVVVWVMRLRHQWASIGAMLALIPASLLPMARLFHRQGKRDLPISPAQMVFWVLLFCLAGILLALDAYRRWCKTEFD
jgi:hypothetical protein